MLWRAMCYEQLAERIDHIAGVQLSLDADRHALSGELIDYTQHAEDLSIMRAILDKIIRPDMALVLRAQPDTRAIIQP